MAGQVMAGQVMAGQVMAGQAMALSLAADLHEDAGCAVLQLVNQVLIKVVGILVKQSRHHAAGARCLLLACENCQPKGSRGVTWHQAQVTPVHNNSKQTMTPAFDDEI